MANQPKTPIRAIRIDDATWGAAKVAASRRGESVSDVVRRALARYGRRYGQAASAPPTKS